MKRQETSEKGKVFQARALRLSSFRFPLVSIFVVFAFLGVAWAQPDRLPSQALPYFLQALEEDATLILTGPVQETQLFPPRKDADQYRSDLPNPPAITLQLLNLNYRSSIAVGEPIAGRETIKISFEPINKIAPRWTFWFDREWKTRLGFEETDFSGQVTTKAHFTVIDGKPRPRNTPRAVRQPLKPKLEAAIKQSLPNLSLPDGFRIVSSRARDVNNQTRLEIRATNGLSTVLLVLAPVASKPGPKLAVRDLRGAWLWVVANLPNADLERIAQSVNGPVDLPSLTQTLADRKG